MERTRRVKLDGMFKGRIRVCRFCRGEIKELDYKNSDTLRMFTTEKGKVLPRRISGCCAKHQRVVAATVKRARHAALMPFQSE